mmetsp:Transcript_80901/g.135347  ORF Transcript_80901/g.135347 Transcript_80901/m.135347 type:complete len:367 (+) Transcript_80901:3404-4504(+)
MDGDWCRRLGLDLALQLAHRAFQSTSDAPRLVSIQDRHEATPDRCLVGRHLLQLALPLSAQKTIILLHLQGKDLVGVQHLAHVCLQGDPGHILVREQRRQEICTNCNPLQDIHLTRLYLLHLLLHLTALDLKRLLLTRVDNLIGSKGHLTVCASWQRRQFAEDISKAFSIFQCTHLAQQRQDQRVAASQLLVRHVQGNDLLQVLLVGLDHFQHSIIHGPRHEMLLHIQILLQQLANLSRHFGGIRLACIRLHQRLHFTSLEPIQHQMQCTESINCGRTGLNVKLASERQDFGRTRWVQQLQTSQLVPGTNDGTGGEHVVDTAGLGCRQRHDHFHGLNLSVRPAGLDLCAILLQESDQAATHIRPQL